MMLEVRGLSYSYERGKPIFSDVSFSLNRGRILSILGPNGAGKSTLLNCIGNLEKPTAGEILLDGTNISRLSLREFASKVGYVPQNHTPTYDYTVEEFVLMGCTPHIRSFGKPAQQDFSLVRETLCMLKIEGLMGKPYTQISGGERQQVLLARAIVQQPEMILLDEPTAHLDFGNQMKAVQLVKMLSGQGYGIIMTTHNPDQVFLAGGDVAVLDRNGRLTVGAAEKIMTEERLAELYGERVRVFYSEELERTICVSGR